MNKGREEFPYLNIFSSSVEYSTMIFIILCLDFNFFWVNYISGWEECLYQHHAAG